MRVAKVLDAAQPGEELEKPLSRHLVLQGELPGQIANPGPYLHAVFPDVEAEDLATPTRRPQEPEQGPYRGGLAGPVGPEEAEDLPFLHGEIQILYAARFAAVGLGKLLGLYRQAHEFLLSYRSNTVGIYFGVVEREFSGSLSALVGGEVVFDAHPQGSRYLLLACPRAVGEERSFYIVRDIDGLGYGRWHVALEKND